MKKKKEKLELVYTAKEEGYNWGPPSGSQARTLPENSIGTHESGWTIEGKVHDDYYRWVNMFKATHPEYGTVSGDFETQVFATRKEGFDHFIKNHPYECWDYMDI